jgi:hypothetical protein
MRPWIRTPSTKIKTKSKTLLESGMDGGRALGSNI